MGKRLALIIGNSVYQDQTLARLQAPDVDVGALRDALTDSQVGGFDDVDLIFNSTSWNVRKSISEFFSRKSRDDLLLLYFSGHGVLDQNGRLYLAVKDSDHDYLRANAISASFISDEMDNSRSRRQVLILDCCHSGAFARGTKGSPGSTVGTASAFGAMGSGRVVLTASDATQYAWEGDRIIGEAQGSLFTHFLVKGLQTGQADYDKDGQITINELYDYVYDQVLQHSPHQTPSKWSSREQGNILIARAPITEPDTQFSAELQPQKFRAGQAARVAVNNHGNNQKTFNITLQDQGEQLDFSPSNAQLSVSPGRSSTLEFRARPRQRRIIGPDRSYSFSAVVSLPRGGTQTSLGEVVAGSLLPPWALPLVTVLFLVGIFATGYSIYSRNQRIITANATAAVEATQQFLNAQSISQAQTAETAAPAAVSTQQFPSAQSISQGRTATFVAASATAKWLADNEVTLEATDANPDQTPTFTLTPEPDSDPTEAAILTSEKDGMTLIHIPAGDFLMGSNSSDSGAEAHEKPQHRVALDSFWIDQTEVTNAMFTRFVNSTAYVTDAERQGLSYYYEDSTAKWLERRGADWAHPLGESSNINGKQQHPVVNVSWNDASEYCKWAGRRLPTEAEWEKAARGEDQRSYPWGNQIPDSELANFNNLVRDTTEVGNYPDGASPYGLFDMAGNVWEWISDRYDSSYYSSSPEQNPTGPSSTEYPKRVARGGGWNNRADFVQAANRHSYDPSFRSLYLGFRCAMRGEP